MFEKVGDAEFVRGEHEALKFWNERSIFAKLREQIAGKPTWSFLDGPITANNPMGVHHAWGRTYKDTFQRYWAMNGRDLRYQNGFDCQGLWVEVEVEKQLGLGAKSQIEAYGIDKFVHACKQRVLKYAAIQTEQSIRLGYWMEWDDPKQLRRLAEAIGTDDRVEFTPPKLPNEVISDTAEAIVSRLGNPDWGGSYFTFSTENNETIWTFLKKCFERGKVYRGHDVMPWSGRGGSAYSQMEVADGRKLTVHRSCFVRFPVVRDPAPEGQPPEFLLVWTTTPWTLTSNVAAAVNPDLDYVKLKTKRDGAIYYFAKDNLEFQRLAKEFKEGFGRPEWNWPHGTPKLKTLGQLFKETGGYEIEGTIKGAEMVGWQYTGPFDDLPAQSSIGGVPRDPRLGEKTGITCHRVIDGGRDFKGNPNVVAGEGTGIVHIAPGCGDVDHQLGIAAGVVGIAPLAEDGRFVDGFGDFTGREATDPTTVDLVFAKLKEKHLLVADEKYPHIYPFCWRTGDELVFRLVDEWFIDMDWRDEIMQVTDRIRWLPDSIQGGEREREWLTNMRDWMISKKRFWGLALPIWINPDDPTDFEVMGSLSELKSRAVEGWDQFEGHTPHKPWIDLVKIRSEKTGAVLSRIPDVGNPWLDAGIVSFSTLGFNTHPEYWRKWYPADLVTECFPGQFRNWFYSLLSMATMMNWDRTEDPEQKKPFKTLLGHRLVMNEAGKPMHKSDGTAIWFEEAAEQLGVDTMRWMYLAQNPASDLRFGTRHPDKPVTLETVHGPTDTTIDGVKTHVVTSTPADETRRLVLIPLWNSYAFFVNYARLDEFHPDAPQVPVANRPEIDRWLLSNLQALISGMRTAFEDYNSPDAARLAAEFINNLSSWYIRRNRRRFWRSKDAGDADKLAAYQTLYEVLVTLTKLLAPMIPFLAERMYQNLVVQPAKDKDGATVPESVHLCAYPTPNFDYLDRDLNDRMSTAQLVVALGHKLRDETNQRVRQPLLELRVSASSAAQRDAIQQLNDVIREELNVKRVTFCDSLADIVKYVYKANLKTLGPKYGKLLNLLREKLPTVDPSLLAPVRNGESVTISLDGHTVTLAPEDVQVGTEQATGWVCADDRGIQLALSTELTSELIREGMARDFIRQVQQLRKDADLEIENHIRIGYMSDDDQVIWMLREWADLIRSETLADELTSAGTAASDSAAVNVGEAKVFVWIERV
ncbi:class I tRNA ligase family protein [Schlesneria paludicola]|uniref:class I tRNA ligase family protein n=1 Tax=Schlesneria paludicola TaxID=360056 RepID=UPI00029B4876|nr:class I tRNA ligase family protein [Schlesneria paludicola]